VKEIYLKKEMLGNILNIFVFKVEEFENHINIYTREDVYFEIEKSELIRQMEKFIESSKLDKYEKTKILANNIFYFIGKSGESNRARESFQQN